MSITDQKDITYQSIVTSGQRKLLVIIGIISLAFFTIQPAILFLIHPQDVNLVFNIAGTLVALTVLILLYVKVPPKYLNPVLLLVSAFFVFYLVYTDPNAATNDNLAYLAILPPIGFFFLGITGGTIYSFLAVATTIFFSFSPFLSTSTLYTQNQIYQTVSALIFEVLLLFFLQDTTDKISSLIHKDNITVREANLQKQQTISQLEEQKAIISQREHQLTLQKADLERLNKMMVGRELRMIELKKKLASLESRLPPTSNSL
jgi:hypothetical protein